jgi:regulator of sigma E protease
MARKRGVRVLEFAIGMGPVLYKKQRELSDGTQGTKFTIRALPIGGFCAFDDEESGTPDDPKAFLNASKKSRFLILAAGSAMNLILGFLLAFVLVEISPYSEIGLPTVTDVTPGSVFAEHADFGPGFTFERINGRAILRQENIVLFLTIAEGREIEIKGKTADGRSVTLSGKFERRDFDGVKRYGFRLDAKEATFADKARLAVMTATDYCRLIWVTLGELVTGRMGIDALAGPVGMGGIVNEVITAETIPFSIRVWVILDMIVLITMNLAVLNLLPIPAVDGGRIIFVIVEAVRRKPVPIKYEGWVHATGFVALIALMVFVFYNDIVRLLGI